MGGSDRVDATDTTGSVEDSGTGVPTIACEDLFEPDELAAREALVEQLVQAVDDLEWAGGALQDMRVPLIDGAKGRARHDHDTLPAHLTYEGEGRYRFAAPRSTTDIEVYLTENFQFGGPGDRITHNLFVMSSYLLDPQPSLLEPDEENPASLSIEYAGPGPLVELLGYGPNPPNPLVLTTAEISDLEHGFRQLEVRAAMSAAHTTGDLSVTYDALTEPLLAETIGVDLPVTFELLDSTATHEAHGLQLEIEAWDMEWSLGYHATIGTINAVIPGDEAQVSVHLEYPMLQAGLDVPLRTITCHR
ncbi:MAG: hypothetical protein AAF799_06375 [Myxococcota bacterium]